jgi:hypothetical protein
MLPVSLKVKHQPSYPLCNRQSSSCGQPQGTAKALGLTIFETFLLRADEVIE